MAYELNQEQIDFINNFTYKLDQPGKDHWFIINESPYQGDCDDFSFTMMYLIAGKSWLRLWWNVLILKTVMWHVLVDTAKAKNQSHMALWVRGAGWIDNIHRHQHFVSPPKFRKRYPYLVPLLIVRALFRKRMLRAMLTTR